MRTDNSIEVVFFGDSICVGQGVAIHDGWVTRISAELSIHARTKSDVVVRNASINGNTTRLALERMPYDVASHGADVLLVQFGMNDCNYWQTDNGVPRVSRAAFQANLHEIIDRARYIGAQRILLNTNHPTTRLAPFPGLHLSYEESNRSYNDIIRAVAAEAGDPVVLNDVEAAIRRSYGEVVDDLLLPDGLHLSREGHDVYFDLVFPVVLKAVREIGAR
jgi:acyl-CoA thioesterase I